MPLARMERGKISPITTQATGPQEIGKNAMQKHTNAISTRRTVMLMWVRSLVLPEVTLMMAMMNSQIHVPIEPMRRRQRQPTGSMG